MNLQKLMRQAQEMQNRLQGELETLLAEAPVAKMESVEVAI